MDREVIWSCDSVKTVAAVAKSMAMHVPLNNTDRDNRESCPPKWRQSYNGWLRTLQEPIKFLGWHQPNEYYVDVD